MSTKARKKLKKIFRDYIDVNIFDMVENNKVIFLSDMGLNSYEIIELICEIEKEFKIEIPDHILGRLKTVQDLIEVLET